MGATTAKRWTPTLGLLIALGCAAGQDPESAVSDTDPFMDAGTDGPEGSEQTGSDGSGMDTDSADSGEPDSGETGGTGEDPPQALPTYADLQQKSSHNAYARHEALVDQLVYHRVRSLELDLHTSSTAGSSISGDWFIYHNAYDTKTTCVRLSDCLRDVGAFFEAVPEHEVVTLWLDLKSDWQDGQRPADLDALLEAAFGSELVTPGDLMERCPEATTLHDAVSQCGWPEADALRGRVVVMLTGGNIDDPSSKLGVYLDEGTVGFVAPSIETADDVAKPQHAQVAVLNVEMGWETGAQAGLKNDYIVREWTLNEEIRWRTAADLGVHHLATDKINLHQDPWATTHDDLGGPFTCIAPGRCGSDPVAEPGVVVGIEVESGDYWDTNDSGWFQAVAVDTSSAAVEETWTTLVSTPNSHVERFAKGCLMARTSLDPQGPSFAVCRPADEEPLRVQIRDAHGASTDAIEDDIVPGGTVDPTSVAWIRLQITDGGHCAVGYGAHRRDQWTLIAEHCFEQPLLYRGLAASAHDAGPVRFLFTDPIRFSDGAQPMTLAAFDEGISFSGASAELFDGPVP